MRGPEGVPIGQLRRINISNVVVSGANPRYGSLIMGIPGHNVEDVTLSHIRILVKGGASKDQAAAQVPESETTYPDPMEFVRSAPIPAYGFFIRHAKGIELNDVQVAFENEDSRPAFILDDVKDIAFNEVRAQTAQGVPAFMLKNVEDFRTHQCRPVADTQLDKVEKKDL
jgi:hypothetical protein